MLGLCNKHHIKIVLFIGPRYPWSDLWVRLSLTFSLQHLVADLTDVTLVDEDTNSIPTNNTNRTIHDNVAMPVTNPGDQFQNICKWSNGQYRNQCRFPGLLHSFMILLKQTWFFVAPFGGQI